MLYCMIFEHACTWRVVSLSVLLQERLEMRWWKSRLGDSQQMVL